MLGLKYTLQESTTLNLGLQQKPPTYIKKVTVRHTGITVLNQHSPQFIIPVWITGMTTEAITTSKMLFTSISSK